MLVLLDNTVLSNFALVRRAELIRVAFSDIATVPQVLAEFQAGVVRRRVLPCNALIRMILLIALIS
jgi:predicted nucleic acid-binding protein